MAASYTVSRSVILPIVISHLLLVPAYLLLVASDLLLEVINLLLVVSDLLLVMLLGLLTQLGQLLPFLRGGGGGGVRECVSVREWFLLHRDKACKSVAVRSHT